MTAGNDDVFEVERILAQKNINGKLHYLIKWKGYPDEQCTWEPKKHIRGGWLMRKWQQMLAAGDTLDEREISILQQRMDAYTVRVRANKAPVQVTSTVVSPPARVKTPSVPRARPASLEARGPANAREAVEITVSAERTKPALRTSSPVNKASTANTIPATTEVPASEPPPDPLFDLPPDPPPESESAPPLDLPLEPSSDLQPEHPRARSSTSQSAFSSAVQSISLTTSEPPPPSHKQNMPCRVYIHGPSSARASLIKRPQDDPLRRMFGSKTNAARSEGRLGSDASNSRNAESPPCTKPDYGVGIIPRPLEQITDSSHITPTIKSPFQPLKPATSQAQDKHGRSVPAVRDSRSAQPGGHDLEKISSRPTQSRVHDSKKLGLERARSKGHDIKKLSLDKALAELGQVHLRSGSKVDREEIRVYISFSVSHRDIAGSIKSWLLSKGLMERHVFDHDKGYGSWKRFNDKLSSCVCVILFANRNPVFTLPGLAKSLEYDNVMCWEVQVAPDDPRGTLQTWWLFPRGTAIAITETTMVEELESCIFILKWLQGKFEEDVNRGVGDYRLLLPSGYSRFLDDNACRDKREGNLGKYCAWLDLWAEIKAVENLTTASLLTNTWTDASDSPANRRPEILVGPEVQDANQVERDRALVEYFAAWSLRYTQSRRRFWAFTRTEALKGYNHVYFRHATQFMEKEKGRKGVK